MKVIDGGTLDNIPVTAAVRAIVDSAAEGLTDRWLLYLSPSPPDPTPDRPPGADARLGSPRAIATTLRSLQARFGVESLLADVHELEAVNRTTCQRRLTMAAAFGGLRPTDPVSRLTEARDDRTVELAAIWTELDVTAVADALRKPQAGDALAAGLTVAPLTGWCDEHELGLRDALAGVLSTSDEAPWNSNSWLGQLARLLVSWARDLETRVIDADLEDTGHIKARAYRLGTMAAALERAQRRRWLKAAQTRNPTVKRTTVEQWAQGTSSDMLRYVPTTFAAQIPDVLAWTSTGAARSNPADPRTPNPPDPLNRWVDELTDNLEQGGDRDLSQALWRAGCHVAQDLTELGARAPAPPAGTSKGGSEIFALLDQLATPDELTQGLESAVTLCAPLALLGPAPDTEIRFAQLTGNAPTPLDKVFENLKKNRAKGRGKRKGNPSPDAPLRASDKLCGDELGNFAAFLSAKWRANDWMWGRLDAVATLVDNLLDPERLAELALAPDGPASFTASLDELVDQIGQVPAGWERLPAPPELCDLPGVPELRDRLAAGPGTDAAGWDQWVQAVHQFRDHVVLVLQWEILASELPVVTHADHDPPQGQDPQPDEPSSRPASLNAVQAEAMVRDYDVGLQGLEDIGDERRVRLFLRAALVAFGALRPDGSSGRGRRRSVRGDDAQTPLPHRRLRRRQRQARPVRGRHRPRCDSVHLLASARRASTSRAGGHGRCWCSDSPPWWRSCPEPEKLPRLVLAGSLAGVALLFGLWSGGGAWASASLLAFGLAAAPGCSGGATGRRPAEKGGKVSSGDQAMYATTILAALGGDRRRWAPHHVPLGPLRRLAVLRRLLRRPAAGRPPGGGHGHVLDEREEPHPGPPPRGRRLRRYGGALRPGRDGPAGFRCCPHWRRWPPRPDSPWSRRWTAGGWPRRVGNDPGPWGGSASRAARCGRASLWPSPFPQLARVPWPRGAWILLAVAAAGYSLTVLATYVDVLRPRPNRDGSVAGASSPTRAGRPIRAAAAPPPPAEPAGVPAPST